MSLRTGALKVSGVPDATRRYPWQPWKREPPTQAAANRHHHTDRIQWKPTYLNRYFPSFWVCVLCGRRGGKNPQRFAKESSELIRNNQLNELRELCNEQQGPCKTPSGHSAGHIQLGGNRWPHWFELFFILLNIILMSPIILVLLAACNLFVKQLKGFQRLGRQNRHMGLWPLGFQSYGPFLKSMGHYSNGVGQKKRNIGIFVSDVTFCTSIIQYREVNIIIK